MTMPLDPAARFDELNAKFPYPYNEAAVRQLTLEIREECARVCEAWVDEARVAERAGPGVYLVGQYLAEKIRSLNGTAQQETNARYRCTRCGRNEIDARENGCERGPCPMELLPTNAVAQVSSSIGSSTRNQAEPAAAAPTSDKRVGKRDRRKEHRFTVLEEEDRVTVSDRRAEKLYGRRKYIQELERTANLMREALKRVPRGSDAGKRKAFVVNGAPTREEGIAEAKKMVSEDMQADAALAAYEQISKGPG